MPVKLKIKYFSRIAPAPTSPSDLQARDPLGYLVQQFVVRNRTMSTDETSHESDHQMGDSESDVVVQGVDSPSSSQVAMKEGPRQSLKRKFHEIFRKEKEIHALIQELEDRIGPEENYEALVQERNSMSQELQTLRQEREPLLQERAAMFQELNRLSEVERKYNTLYQENNKFLNSIQLSKEGLREQGRKMAVEKAQAVREAEYFKQRDESTQLANSSLKDQNRILEDRLKQAETRLEEFEAERREKGIPAVTNDDPIVLETMDFVNGMYRQFNVLQTPRHEPGNQEF